MSLQCNQFDGVTGDPTKATDDHANMLPWRGTGGGLPGWLRTREVMRADTGNKRECLVLQSYGVAPAKLNVEATRGGPENEDRHAMSQGRCRKVTESDLRVKEKQLRAGYSISTPGDQFFIVLLTLRKR